MPNPFLWLDNQGLVFQAMISLLIGLVVWLFGAIGLWVALWLAVRIYAFIFMGCYLSNFKFFDDGIGLWTVRVIGFGVMTGVLCWSIFAGLVGALAAALVLSFIHLTRK